MKRPKRKQAVYTGCIVKVALTVKRVFMPEKDFPTASDATEPDSLIPTTIKRRLTL